MKASASIELLWQIAVQEAIAGEFSEMEPEHFLAALLKFAELPVDDLDKLAPGTEVARELASEIQTVCRELAGRSIDSKRVRRELRSRLGNGGHPHDGSQLHRSKACRDVFDSAAALAGDSSSEVLVAEHLLAALLAAPTSAMRAVLPPEALRAKGNPAKPVNRPLLEKHARDLVQMAASGELAPISSRQAECNALVQLLSDPKGRTVFLVSDNDEAVHQVILAVAQAIASAEPPARLKGKRLLDVTAASAAATESSRSLDELQAILTEAADAKDIVLVVPPIEAAADPNQVNPWAQLLKRLLGSKTIQCICRLSTRAYERWIKKDPDWRRLTQVMHMHDAGYGDIPTEL